MKVVVLLSVVCFLIHNSAALIPSFLEYESCPKIPSMANLDLYRFSGMWFTVKTVPNEYSSAVSCINTNYTFRNDHLLALERGVTKDGVKVSSVANVKYEDGTDLNRPTFIVETSSSIFDPPLQVIATDYDSYACQYSCMSFAFGTARAEFAWVLSRQPNPPPQVAQACDRLLQQYEFDLTKLNQIPQTNTCGYFKNLDVINRSNENIKRLAIEAATNKQGASGGPAQEGSAVLHEIREEEKVKRIN